MYHSLIGKNMKNIHSGKNLLHSGLHHITPPLIIVSIKALLKVVYCLF